MPALSFFFIRKGRFLHLGQEESIMSLNIANLQLGYLSQPQNVPPRQQRLTTLPSSFGHLNDAFTKLQEDSVKSTMSLLIKADKNVFYGRVLQVVEKAKEAHVSTFAFVTNIQSSQLSDN